MTKFLVIGENCGYKKWLFDQREIKVLVPITIDWILNDWYPHSVEVLSSERKITVVRSQDVFAKISSESIVSQILLKEDFKEGYLQKDFDILEETYLWLEQLELN